jgi:hypothetical protein
MLHRIGTHLVDIKVEYTFYIDRKNVERIAYLQENYNEEEDTIQVAY